MNKFILAFAFTLVSTTSIYAASGCLFPEYPYTAKVVGYFKVASSDCSSVDLEKAKLGAEEETFYAAVLAKTSVCFFRSFGHVTR